MEKNLNKYLTVEEASKQNYITSQMIASMIERNLVPYFNDRGAVRVYPGDIAQAVSELLGVEEKKVLLRAKSKDKQKEASSSIDGGFPHQLEVTPSLNSEEETAET